MNFTGLSIIQRPTLVTDWRTLEEWNKSKPQESVGTTLLYQSIAGILTLFPQLVGCLVVSSPVARLTGSDTWLGGNWQSADNWRDEGDFTASPDLWAEACSRSRGPGLAPVQIGRTEPEPVDRWCFGRFSISFSLFPSFHFVSDDEWWLCYPRTHEDLTDLIIIWNITRKTKRSR